MDGFFSATREARGDRVAQGEPHPIRGDLGTVTSMTWFREELSRAGRAHRERSRVPRGRRPRGDPRRRRRPYRPPRSRSERSRAARAGRARLSRSHAVDPTSAVRQAPMATPRAPARMVMILARGGAHRASTPHSAHPSDPAKSWLFHQRPPRSVLALAGSEVRDFQLGMETSKDAGDKPRRVIKRYSNRKLYDTRDSRYVTLQQIGEMVRAGEEVQIIDNKTKEDKTEVTLALILSEDLKSQPAAFRSAPFASSSRSEAAAFSASSARARSGASFLETRPARAASRGNPSRPSPKKSRSSPRRAPTSPRRRVASASSWKARSPPSTSAFAPSFRA